MEQLKYPIGKFKRPERFDQQIIDENIKIIASFPQQLESLVAGLSEESLDWVYRPGGWTIRQVIHHCADSHMNSLIRFKLSLTEEQPVIKPYFEDRWAELPDTTEASITSSLQLLKGLHERWMILLESLTEEDLQRVFIHPEMGESISLWVNVSLYGWHCSHHLAHVEQAIRHKGQFE